MTRLSGPGASRSIDGILEGVAVEAYHQVLREAWRVVPERFFNISDTEAAATSGSVPE